MFFFQKKENPQNCVRFYFQKEENHPNFVMLFPEKGKSSKFCHVFFQKWKILLIVSCFFQKNGKSSIFWNAFPRIRKILKIVSCFFQKKENPSWKIRGRGSNNRPPGASMAVTLTCALLILYLSGNHNPYNPLFVR